MSARILIVDDVLANVKVLAAKLSREYFEVITASNGLEALELVRREMPDIVLLDVMMPGMNGFEVCEKIRSDPATMHIPVVMITALSDTAHRVHGLEVGADDFLTKPVNDTALFARVRSLVRLKMMIDEWRLRESTSVHLGVTESTGDTLRAEPHENARALVLEDSPPDLDIITETLSRDSNHVVAVRTGAEALSRALGDEFDLLVVSLTLLNEDGLRLVSQIRSHERTRQTPILLVVDGDDLHHIVKGLELGANDYAIKPLDHNELLARMRTQIRRKRYQERLRANYTRSLSMALVDSLTGVFNRRYINAHLPRLLDHAVSDHKSVSVLMIDIDHFKMVNDTYGHDVGDEVLREVALRAGGNLRSVDLLARLGGEEFIVIVPDATLENAQAVAERLRQRIGGAPFKISAPIGEIPVTVSIGVAACNRCGDLAESLIKRSDLALYQAKRQGRNRVTLAPQDELVVLD